MKKDIKINRVAYVTAMTRIYNLMWPDYPKDGCWIKRNVLAQLGRIALMEGVEGQPHLHQLTGAYETVCRALHGEGPFEEGG